MASSIPVTYNFKGKQYSGYLCPTHGAASKIYHLMVDSFYRGQLNLVSDGRWQFSNQEGYQPDLADYFAQVVTAWCE